MDFLKQVSNAKVVIGKPKVYLQWTNTEIGRDKYDCWERIDDGCFTIYINTHNTSVYLTKGDKFFEDLEKMYLMACHAKKIYYMSLFDFFYPTMVNLGEKFAKSAFNGNFTTETDVYDLTTVLSMVAKGFEENEKEFIHANIDILDLINGVVKRVDSF